MAVLSQQTPGQESSFHCGIKMSNNIYIQATLQSLSGSLPAVLCALCSQCAPLAPRCVQLTSGSIHPLRRVMLCYTSLSRRASVQSRLSPLRLERTWRIHLNGSAPVREAPPPRFFFFFFLRGQHPFFFFFFFFFFFALAGLLSRLLGRVSAPWTRTERVDSESESWSQNIWVWWFALKFERKKKSQFLWAFFPESSQKSNEVVALVSRGLRRHSPFTWNKWYQAYNVYFKTMWDQTTCYDGLFFFFFFFFLQTESYSAQRK